MSETKEQEKHTSGKWYFDPSTAWVKTDEYLICGVYRIDKNIPDENDQRIPNGYLIAAAPELLEASRDAYALLAAIRADGYSGDCLPQLDEMLDGDDKEDSSLTKAIAKAEGRQ